jgi:hypothetical protein
VCVTHEHKLEVVESLFHYGIPASDRFVIAELGRDGIAITLVPAELAQSHVPRAMIGLA